MKARFAASVLFLSLLVLLCAQGWSDGSSWPFGIPVGPVVDAGSVFGNYQTGLGVNLAADAAWVHGPLPLVDLQAGLDGGVIQMVGGVPTWAALSIPTVPDSGPAISISGTGFAHVTGGTIDTTANLGSPGQAAFTVDGGTTWRAFSGDIGCSTTDAGACTVDGLQSVPLSAAAPTIGQIMAFDGGAWGPTNPPPGAPSNGSWSNATWCIDGQNTSGCASNSNTGTQCTCGGGNAGPLRDFTGAGLSQQWATVAPTLTQATGLTWISDASATDTANGIRLKPTLVGSGFLTLCGTLLQQGTGTLGTITAKGRAAHQLTVAGLGQAASPFVDFYLQDTTHPAWAIIDSASGNNATLSQPLATVVGTACAPVAGFTETDVLQAGDSYVIWRGPKVPLVEFRPTAGATSNSGSLLPAILSNITIPSAAGTSLQNVYVANGLRSFSQNIIYPRLFLDDAVMAEEPSFITNDRLAGGIQTNQAGYGSEGATIMGGTLGTSGAANNFHGVLDGDVVVHGFTVGMGSLLIALAYFDSTVDAVGYSKVFPNAFTSAIWGTGSLIIDSFSTFQYTSSAVSQILLSGGINAGTTSCALDVSLDPMPLHCGRAMTPANLDATVAAGGFGGVSFNPTSSTTISKIQALPTPTAFVTSLTAGGTGLTSGGAADQLLGMNHAGTALQYFTAAGDERLASGVFTTVGIQGNTVTAGSLTKGDFLVATSSTNWAQTACSGDVVCSSTVPGQMLVADVDGVAYPAGPLTAGTVPIASSSSAVAYGALNRSNPATFTGLEPVSGGGTNANALPAHSIMVGETTTVSTIAPWASEQPLVGTGGSSDPAPGCINLAGGSSFVCGALPSANQAPQTLAGDARGLSGANRLYSMSGDPATLEVTLGNSVSLVATPGDPGTIDMSGSSTGEIIAGPNGVVTPSIDRATTGSFPVGAHASIMPLGNSSTTYFLPGLAGTGTRYVDVDPTGTLNPSAGPVWHTTTICASGCALTSPAPYTPHTATLLVKGLGAGGTAGSSCNGCTGFGCHPMNAGGAGSSAPWNDTTLALPSLAPITVTTGGVASPVTCGSVTGPGGDTTFVIGGATVLDFAPGGPGMTSDSATSVNDYSSQSYAPMGGGMVFLSPQIAEGPFAFAVTPPVSPGQGGPGGGGDAYRSIAGFLNPGLPGLPAAFGIGGPPGHGGNAGAANDGYGGGGGGGSPLGSGGFGGGGGIASGTCNAIAGGAASGFGAGGGGAGGPCNGGAGALGGLASPGWASISELY